MLNMRMLFLPALVLAAACAGPRTPAPAEVAYGLDVCDYCHMSVDDGGRAAQWVGADGAVRKFDEPGCLIAWMQRNPATNGAAFVGDAAGRGWVAAEQAFYLRGGVRTGMGFDVLAFTDETAAQARAARVGGEVIDWATLRTEGVDHAHES